MKITNVNGVEVAYSADMSEEEARAYIPALREKYPRMGHVELNVDGEDVTALITDKAVPFERIKRITGYLVGTIDRWNNAKRAEEKDRVKHGI